MTLQAAIEAELPFLRGEALARMKSRVKVRREDGLADQDEDTGIQPRNWDVTHEDVPFRLGGTPRGAATTRRLSTPGGDVEVPVRVGSFAYDIANLLDGDLIELTAGENAGVVIQIVESTWQDQATARRVLVIGAQRPVEWG